MLMKGEKKKRDPGCCERARVGATVAMWSKKPASKDHVYQEG